MASGYDPVTRSGGMLGNALHHLEAVAAGAPEAVEADALALQFEIESLGVAFEKFTR